MQFSNDQKHAETLEFLSSVRDYLATWPQHPMNRQMIAEIEAHLRDPIRNLVRQHAYSRSGANFTPAGACVLQATLCEDLVTVSLPTRCAVDEALVLRRLKKGEPIRLRPDETF